MSCSESIDLTGNDEFVHDTVIDLTIEDCCNSALLLGMVFATEQRPKRGQEYRDRVRCESLEKLGFNVKTLDDKHNDTDLRNHCNANFLDARRMLKSMQAKWSKQKFNLVILDYFFSPIGWARERWSNSLFSKTLPTLAESGYLAKDCQIWLPNLQCIEDSMQACYNDLKPYFIIRKESDPMANPLYQATETVEEDLRLCPDALTNENQLRPLLNYSSQPFYVLQLRFIFDKVPLTTQSGQYAVGTSVTKKRKLA